MKKSSSWLPLFPLVLFVINLLTKSFFLTNEDICLDEPFSIYHAQFSFPVLIGQLKSYNNPPLYEILLHGWIKLFGISAISVRTLPLIFASLCPTALFYLCKNNFGNKNAVAASLLLSASTLLVFYAHDCRVYSLFLLLCILSMALFMELIKRTKSKLLLPCFIFINSLLIYAHYFGVFIWLLQFSTCLIYQRHLLLKLCLCYLISLVLYLPQIYVLYTRMSVSVKNGTWIEAPSGLESIYNMLWAFSNAPVVTVVCIVILIVSLVYAFMKKFQQRVPANVFMVITWFIFPFLGLFLISYKVPVFISRYLIFALPAYYIIIAGCVETLLSKYALAKPGLVVLVLLFGFSTDLNPAKKRQISEAMRLTHLLKDEQTLVVVAPRDFLSTFCYHYASGYFASVSNSGEYVGCDSLLRLDNVLVPVHEGELNDRTLRHFKKIVLFSDGSNDFQKNILKHIQSGYSLRFNRRYNNYYQLSYFIAKEKPPGTPEADLQKQ